MQFATGAAYGHRNRPIAEQTSTGTIGIDSGKGTHRVLARRDGCQAVNLSVTCGPREVDRADHRADEWSAGARGPDKERLEGRGSGPQDALLALTVNLRELRGVEATTGIEPVYAVLQTAP